MRKLLFILLFLLILPNSAQAGFWDKFKNTIKRTTDKEDISQTAAEEFLTGELSAEEISQGLLEALRIGTERAVSLASAKDGFLDNPEIHIPVPEKLNKITATMKRFGMGSFVTDFESTLNHAAEEASKKALPIFSRAVQELTLEDAGKLLAGKDNAITEYFKEQTWQPLYEEFLPVVHNSARKVGVTRAYNKITDFPAVNTLTTGTDLDLDHYVTDKALAGLFTLLADEEKQIRTAPVARTTELLKKVFE